MNTIGSTQKHLIFDIGNSTSKIGYSAEDKPSSVFDTVTRTKLYKFGASSTLETKQSGKRVTHPCLYKFGFPVTRGVYNNFDDMNVIFRNAADEVKAKTFDNIPVFVCDSLNSSVRQRFRLTEMLINSFKSPLIYFASQPILALYGMGKTSGCVVDVGHGTTQVACVYENFKITQSCDVMNVGGFDIEQKLASHLHSNGVYIHKETEYALLRSLKESHCYVNFDESTEPGTCSSDLNETQAPKDLKNLRLPDGERVDLSSIAWEATEVLFNPVDFNSKLYGIPQFVKYAIERADLGIKNDLFADVNLVGGTSCLKGFCERFSAELRKLASKHAAINVKASKDKSGNEAWTGAQVVLTSNNFDFGNLWIQKNDINEFGEQIFYRKCLM